MGADKWGRPSRNGSPPPPPGNAAAPCELRDFSARLTVPADIGPIAIVMDAARLAADARAATAALKLGAELLRHLPPDCLLGVYFLGSPEPRPETRVLTEGSREIASAAGNISVLRPVLRGLRARYGGLQGARLLVLGAGPIYDLPDLLDTPELRPVILCSCGDAALLPPGCEAKSLTTTEACAQAILPRLVGAGAQVRLSAPGFCPYSWDNDRYELRLEQEKVLLQTPPDQVAAGLSVDLLFLAPGPTTVLTADVTGSDGTVTRSQLTATPTDPPHWSRGLRHSYRLTGRELAAFRSIIEGTRFLCPVCDATHAPTETVCRITSEAGVPVLRCFGDPEGQVAVFRVTETGDVDVYTGSGRALRPTADTVVVTRPRPSVLRFDPGTGTWRRRDLVNYELIGPVRIAVPDRLGEQAASARPAEP